MNSMDAKEIISDLESLMSKLVEENARLSKENKHINVAFLATRMETWQLEWKQRLETFDANHTRAQALLVERMENLENRLDKLVERLAKRFKDADKTNGD